MVLPPKSEICVGKNHSSHYRRQQLSFLTLMLSKALIKSLVSATYLHAHNRTKAMTATTATTAMIVTMALAAQYVW